MKQKRLQIQIASYLLLTKNNKILMMRRFNTGWSDGMYTLPSGHIDKGEMPLETICREAKEEVDVIVNPLNTNLIHIHFEKDNYVDFYFQTDSWNGTPVINEPDKCDKLNWLKFKELDNYEIPKKIKVAILSIREGNYYSQSD